MVSAVIHIVLCLSTFSEEGGGGQLDEFGIDPSLEPELAMALRISMEEERARVRAQQQAGSGQTETPAAATTTTGAAPMDTGTDSGKKR